MRTSASWRCRPVILYPNRHVPLVKAAGQADLAAGIPHAALVRIFVTALQKSGVIAAYHDGRLLGKSGTRQCCRVRLPAPRRECCRIASPDVHIGKRNAAAPYRFLEMSRSSSTSPAMRSLSPPISLSADLSASITPACIPSA